MSAASEPEPGKSPPGSGDASPDPAVRGAAGRPNREEFAQLTAPFRPLPPLPTWFTGREQIRLLLQSHALLRPGDFTVIRTAANGQPALAIYHRDQDGMRQACAIQVLTFTASRVARVVAFRDRACSRHSASHRFYPLPAQCRHRARFPLRRKSSPHAQLGSCCTSGRTTGSNQSVTPA
jgi:hypothetical protein